MTDTPIFAADWSGEVLAELHHLRSASGSDWDAPLVAHFERILEGDERPSARYLLGQAYTLAGRFYDAVEQFQASRTDPALARASWSWLGICYAGMQGMHGDEMAIASFRKGLEQDGDLPLRYNLALMLERSGAFEEAACEYDRIVDADGGFADARARGQVARRLHDLSRERAVRGTLPVPHAACLERGRGATRRARGS